jgi:hypothetical protein
MKMNTIFLLGFIFIQSSFNWIQISDEKVLQIDQYGRKIKSKVLSDEFGTFIMNKYKYKKLEKYTFSGHSFLMDTGCFSFYSENNLWFLYASFSIEKYLHKGYSDVEREVGTISETKEYYQTKSHGIRFKRSIDYFENSNKDSLREVLSQMPFDTLYLNSGDYKKTTSFLKRMKRVN